jgi:transcriptional regulator with XRE-family HTH domain
MARAALKWGVRDLAEKSGVTANTISRFENGADAYGETIAKLERTLQAAGISFIREGEISPSGGPGIRLHCGD